MKPNRAVPSVAPVSAAPQVTMVSLAAITRDARFQARGLHAPTVKAYANALRAGTELPPLTLGLIGTALVLLGGWHRFSAYEGIGASEARAVIVKTTAREALWIAARDNLAHGRPLSGKEKRSAFRFFIRARAHVLPAGRIKSYREIARDLGGTVTHHTVRNWMTWLYPKIAAQMSRDLRDNPEAMRPPGAFARTQLQEALDGLRTAENAAHSLADHPGALSELLRRVDALRSFVAGEEARIEAASDF